MWQQLVQMTHLLALGLWAGAMVFFSFFTALPILSDWPSRLQQPGHWLQISEARQATRAAGEVLDILFQRYFPFQVVCGLIAVITGAGSFMNADWLSKVRGVALVTALILASLNWLYLAPAVHQARLERYSSDPQVAQAGEAKFGPAHSRSLQADLVVLTLVLFALGSSAWLPGTPRPPVS
jgi:putative copper export protein